MARGKPKPETLFARFYKAITDLTAGQKQELLRRLQTPLSLANQQDVARIEAAWAQMPPDERQNGLRMLEALTPSFLPNTPADPPEQGEPSAD